MVSCLFSPNPMWLEKVEWDHPADIDPICGQLGIQPASHAEQVHPWLEECSQSYVSQKRTSSFWLQALYSGKMYNRPTNLSFMSSGDTWLIASGDTWLGAFDNLLMIQHLTEMQ